jgi:hypothetical protein
LKLWAARVDRLVSEHLRTQRRSTHIVPLLLKLKEHLLPSIAAKIAQFGMGKMWGVTWKGVGV